MIRIFTEYFRGYRALTIIWIRILMQIFSETYHLKMFRIFPSFSCDMGIQLSHTLGFV